MGAVVRDGRQMDGWMDALHLISLTTSGWT